MARPLHLDSCILRSLIDEEDGREEIRLGRRLLNIYKRESFCISAVAVGEVMGLMPQKRSRACCEKAEASFHSMMERGKLIFIGVGDGEGSFVEALEIMRSDPRATSADALIAALAIEDQECGGLVTYDKNLIYNRHVIRSFRAQGKRLVDPREIDAHGQIASISAPFILRSDESMGKTTPRQSVSPLTV